MHAFPVIHPHALAGGLPLFHGHVGTFISWPKVFLKNNTQRTTSNMCKYTYRDIKLQTEHPMTQPYLSIHQDIYNHSYIFPCIARFS